MLVSLQLDSSIEGRYDMAIVAVLISCCLDGLDGLLARLLDATSNFGAQLDSLSDAVTFGVAPCIIVYLWLIEMVGDDASSYFMGWLWVPFLTFAVCNIFRLGSVSMLECKKRVILKLKAHFFMEYQHLLGAYLILMPLGLDFLSKRFNFSFSEGFTILLVVVWVLFVSALMISTIPTPSLKSIKFTLSKTRRVLF